MALMMLKMIMKTMKKLKELKVVRTDKNVYAIVNSTCLPHSFVLPIFIATIKIK